MSLGQHRCFIWNKHFDYLVIMLFVTLFVTILKPEKALYLLDSTPFV